MPRIVTPAVARDVSDIVRDHHRAAAAAIFGREAVSDADWDLAVRLGLVDPTAPPPDAMTQLHTHGAGIAAGKEPPKPTEAEERAAKASAARAAEYVVGLGNKAGATLGSHLIEADQELDARLRQILRDAVAGRFGDAEAQERMRQVAREQGLDEGFFRGQLRETVRRMASDMGHATKDWTRDLQRIAQTEGHRAVEEGIREGWLAQEEEKEPEERKPVLVFKLPRPGCCDDCARLYLDGDVPRVFTLDHLTANGTNVGVKRAAWKAVVGPMHPWCGCTLHKVPRVVKMPKGWKSGDAAPTVIGPGGTLVAGGSP